jgi:hypothetical protein
MLLIRDKFMIAMSSRLFAVGPEDIGKPVYVRSANRSGIIVWFTPERVCVLSSSDKKAHEYKYEDCMYLRNYIRH